MNGRERTKIRATQKARFNTDNEKRAAIVWRAVLIVVFVLVVVFVCGFSYCREYLAKIRDLKD